MVEGNLATAQATLERALASSSVLDNPMLKFELHTLVALVQAASSNGNAAQQTLEESPRSEGLSIWAELDRDLAESCGMFANGQMNEACQFVAQVARHSRHYPYYYHSAMRLAKAIQTAAPLSTLPRVLWCME